MNLPTYTCHKTVRAARVQGVDPDLKSGAVSLVLALPDGSKVFHPVSAEFVQKHNPQSGGYFVKYEDGYESFSPAKAFEEGYSLERDGEERPEDAARRFALEIASLREELSKLNVENNKLSADNTRLRGVAAAVGWSWPSSKIARWPAP